MFLCSFVQGTGGFGSFSTFYFFFCINHDIPSATRKFISFRCYVTVLNNFMFTLDFIRRECVKLLCSLCHWFSPGLVWLFIKSAGKAAATKICVPVKTISSALPCMEAALLFLDIFITSYEVHKSCYWDFAGEMLADKKITPVNGKIEDKRFFAIWQF